MLTSSASGWIWGLTVVAVGFFIFRSIWSAKAEQRRLNALDERFSGFSHAINAALGAGFAVDRFDGGDFPQCRFQVGHGGPEPTLAVHVQFNGAKRGLLYIDAYDSAAKVHFTARSFEGRYRALSAGDGDQFRREIDHSFFAGIVVAYREWLKGREVGLFSPTRRAEFP